MRYVNANGMNTPGEGTPKTPHRAAGAWQRMRQAWPMASLGMGLLVNAAWIALVCYGLIKLL
jgi:hypothetical protein